MVSVLVTFLIAETKDKSTMRGEAFLRFTAAQWRTHEFPPPQVTDHVAPTVRMLVFSSSPSPFWPTIQWDGTAPAPC